MDGHAPPACRDPTCDLVSLERHSARSRAHHSTSTLASKVETRTQVPSTHCAHVRVAQPVATCIYTRQHLSPRGCPAHLADAVHRAPSPLLERCVLDLSPQPHTSLHGDAGRAPPPVTHIITTESSTHEAVKRHPSRTSSLMFVFAHVGPRSPPLSHLLLPPTFRTSLRRVTVWRGSAFPPPDTRGLRPADC
jgi:hypothetical protein